MKTTTTIENNDLRLELSPESDLDRLIIRELGDDISISRCHNNVVLRRRSGAIVKSIDSIELAEADAT